MGSKSPVVRRAAVGLVNQVLGSAPRLLVPAKKDVASLVLSLLVEKEPAVHAAAVECMLHLLQCWPDAWEAMGEGHVRKAVLPKLMQLLRSAGHGSAEAMLPIALPVLASMPRSMLGPGLDVLRDALAALAEGWRKAVAEAPVLPSASVRAAFRDCFQDLARLVAARALQQEQTGVGAEILPALMELAFGAASPIGATLAAGRQQGGEAAAAWSDDVSAAAAASCEALARSAGAATDAPALRAALSALAGSMAAAHDRLEEHSGYWTQVSSLLGLLSARLPGNDLVAELAAAPAAALCRDSIRAGRDRDGSAARCLASLLDSFGTAVVSGPGATGASSSGPDATGGFEALLDAYLGSVPGTSSSRSSGQLLARFIKASTSAPGKLWGAVLGGCLGLTPESMASAAAARAALLASKPGSKGLRLLLGLVQELEAAGVVPRAAADLHCPAADALAAWLPQPDALLLGDYIPTLLVRKAAAASASRRGA